jgi:hypothetical protein
VSCHETVWGSGSISPRVLNLGTRQRQLVTSIPRQLFLQSQSLQSALGTRICGPRNQCGHEEKKNCLLLSGIKHWHHDHPARNLVTTLTELFEFFNQRNLPMSIIPHVSHNLVLSESHPGRHGYNCCCDLCEISAELEQSAIHRAYNAI